MARYFLKHQRKEPTESYAYRLAYKLRPCVVRRSGPLYQLNELSTERQHVGQEPFELSDKEVEALKVQMRIEQ